MKKYLIAIILATCAACSGAVVSEEPEHMLRPEGATEPDKPGLRHIQAWDWTDEDGNPVPVEKLGGGSAFTLPDGYGFGVYPPGGKGNPASIPDSTCTNAYVHQPVHSVNRCNIPEFKNWTYRVTRENVVGIGIDTHIIEGVNAVNDIAASGSGLADPLVYTTSSSARIRFHIEDDFPSTPEYTREAFMKVRVGDSYLANSQIGPIRRYGTCTVTINFGRILQYSQFHSPAGPITSSGKNFIHSLAMKGAWQCLGRGTDYYGPSWRCQPHHKDYVSPAVTCGWSTLTNADLDHALPYWDNPPLLTGGAPQAWGDIGNKVNFETLWYWFEPN